MECSFAISSATHSVLMSDICETQALFSYLTPVSTASDLFPKVDSLPSLDYSTHDALGPAIKVDLTSHSVKTTDLSTRNTHQG